MKILQQLLKRLNLRQRNFLNKKINTAALNGSFWHALPKPILALAPMADVTDAPFRRMIAKYSRHTRADGTDGGPDVFWTEFVAADGLVRATEEGKKKLLADLMYTEEERPIVAQIFSSNPEHMEQAAALCRELGFDGIDINMGCPDRTIEKQGCGSAMIKTPDKAVEIIRATKRGAQHIPVSVKTRIGYNKNEIDTWIPILLAEHPAVITLHARTRKEMSKVPARWEHVAQAVNLRNQIQGNTWQKENPKLQKTLIIGNGDMTTLEEGRQNAIKAGADGVMFGRAIFGNPWFFHPEKQISKIPTEEKLSVLCEHSRLFEELLPFKNFAVMKKHYKAYVNGFDGARELRAKLMEQNSSEQVQEVVNRFLQPIE